MTEKELIGKIRELRQIRPSKNWVILTKKNILGEEFDRDRFSVISFLEIFRFNKLVFAPVLAVFVLITVFGFAQNSLPGDSLYPIKRISEKAQAIFVSEEEKSKVQLELANKRLEELTRIVEENKIKQLAPALEEFQASVSQAAKALKKPKKITKEIVQQTKKLEENKEKVEALGVVVGGTKEFDNALVQLVEWKIKDLEERTLTEEQQKVLAEAKKDFEAGNYSEALIKIYNLSDPENL